jgi:alanyl-tRNA synthetase
MFAENENLAREIAAIHRERLEEMAAKICSELATDSPDGTIIVRRELEMKPELVKNLMLMMRGRSEKLAMVVGIRSDEKPTLAILLGDFFIKKGLNAGAIVRQAAAEIDGSGGGQPFFAMAGGKNVAGLARAMDKAVELITQHTDN